MKKLLLLIAFALFAAGAGAQSRQTVKGLDLDKFSVVNLSGKMNVKLIPSGQDSISIVLHDADLEKLKWGVSKGELSVSLKMPGNQKGRADVVIYLSRWPKTISMSGGELIVPDTMSANMPSFVISGGCKLSAVVDCIDLELSISGNSTANITGIAKYSTITAWESSKVDCRQLQAVSVTAEASTGAEIFLWATERAVMTAKTGASIFFRGNPTIRKESLSKIGLGATINNIGQ